MKWDSEDILAALGQERPFAFRERLDQLHRPDRRDAQAVRASGEVEIANGWRIIVRDGADASLMHAAKDLQDYFLVSMKLPLLLQPVADLAQAATDAHVLVIGTADDLDSSSCGLKVKGSYRLLREAERVVICGADARGGIQGCYHVEELLNLREAPMLELGDVVREPLFAPRMVHSGWGIDQFPDSHLDLMAHHGLNAVLLFARAVDQTTRGYCDFNDLVRRAALRGIDVYLYSYLKSDKHPDDPDAQSYYEKTYGALFEACPGAKGVVMVGESVEFPSRDPRTTGRSWKHLPESGIPDVKPSPGWWPCTDFPQWVGMVKDQVRRHNPDADIVFWTYNWGWAPEQERLALIRALPTDITLLVTFEMFEQCRHDDVTHVTVDYTISFAGPGDYFRSEAAEAQRCGIRLYAMANTAGMTWDFGTVPFIPAPFQWAARNRAVTDAHRQWGLAGLMECHHYGWWPSPVAEMAKWAFWSPSPSPEIVAERLIRRDYGEAAVASVLSAWQAFSDVMNGYLPTNEDQYGPMRVGPSYPLIFQPVMSRQFMPKDLQLASAPYAWHKGIVLTNYRPLDDPRQSPGSARIHVEIEVLKGLIERWEQGLDDLAQGVTLAPESKRETGLRFLALCRFVRHFLVTTLHVKRWYLLNQTLMRSCQPEEMTATLDAMAELGAAEIANARAAIPLVQADSRLGWEPSMEYVTDAKMLEWKIAYVQAVIEREIPEYRRSVALTGRMA